MHGGCIGAVVPLAFVLRFSFCKGQIAATTLSMDSLFCGKKGFPGKMKLGLIFIQIGFLQWVENEVIMFLSGIVFKKY